MNDELVMYIIANKGLGMSPGKLAAQVAHAAVESYVGTGIHNPDLADKWLEESQTKIVLEAKSEEHLEWLAQAIVARDIECTMIFDQGRTEIPSNSLTAVGINIDWESNLAFLQGLALYK